MKAGNDRNNLLNISDLVQRQFLFINTQSLTALYNNNNNNNFVCLSTLSWGRGVKDSFCLRFAFFGLEKVVVGEDARQDQQTYFQVFTSSPIEVFLEIPFLARISGLTVKLSCCPTSGLHWATTCGSLGGVNALPQFWVLWLWGQERNLPSSEVFKQHTQQGAQHDHFMFVMIFAVLYTTCWLYVVCWLESIWPSCSKHRKLISKYCIVGDKFDKVY